MSTEQIIIEANLTYDEAGNRPLPRLIGPFPNLVAAYEYIGSLGPVWGEWTTAPVLVPEPQGEPSDALFREIEERVYAEYQGIAGLAVALVRAGYEAGLNARSRHRKDT